MDILPDVLERAGQIRPLRESLRLWSLVLEARGVEHRLRDDADASSGWRLEVLDPLAMHAEAEIIAFERENRHGRGRLLPPRPPSALALPGALAVVLGLIGMHGLTSGGLGDILSRVAGVLPGGDVHEAWVRLGAADARLMVHFGEWYRAVTALTLHAGPGHLGGNACLGGVFLALAGRELGLGVALCLTILSGTLGNLLNAWFYDSMHVSLGASTAVFGLLGALTMHRSLVLLAGEGPVDDRPALAWARVFGPLAAGIFLLGLFGTGGGEPDGAGRTDVLAHLFGFAAGVGLGWVLHWSGDWFGDWSRRPGVGWALGLGSLGLVAAAWGMALF